MNKNLLDLSEKIDQLTVSVYETITKVADSSGIKYFIVGASARDIVLRYGYGIHTIRATVDLGNYSGDGVKNLSDCELKSLEIKFALYYPLIVEWLKVLMISCYQFILLKLGSCYNDSIGYAYALGSEFRKYFTCLSCNMRV